MNNKQTILKILDKHRDMSLTMGCEVVRHSEEFHKEDKTMTVLRNDDGRIGSLEQRGFLGYDDLERLKVLGHPATPLTLLKALEERFRYSPDVEFLGDELLIKYSQPDIKKHIDIYLPLTTTLSEIPEEHEIWQAVLDVLI